MSTLPDGFCYSHRIGFVDTDAMGVVHHSNYLRYFEQARVEWLRHNELNMLHYPHADMTLAVLETRIRHFAPARFDDVIRIFTQARSERLRVHFQYKVLAAKSDQILAVGHTILVPIDGEFKPRRLPEAMATHLEAKSWTETWL